MTARNDWADIHSAAIALDRRVQKSVDLGKSDYLIKFTLYLCSAHAEDGAIQENILASGQVRVKARANLQQRGNPAPQPRRSAGWLGNPAENLQKRALACSISTNDADDLAGLNGEGDAPEGPQFALLLVIVTSAVLHPLAMGVKQCGKPVAHRSGGLPEPISFREVLHFDHRRGHETSFRQWCATCMRGPDIPIACGLGQCRLKRA